MNQCTQNFINALEGAGNRVAKTGNGYFMCQCPAHKDQRSSMSVKDVDDRVLIYCHAGCSLSDITGALGMRIGDLFERNGMRDKLIDVYPYCDEQGTLLYEVLRYEGKTFKQRSADGSWSIKGLRRVPYHLPRLLDGVASGKTIYVVEGERDVHSIEKRGGYATCNSGGAGKWSPDFARFFAGAGRVVIVADKDSPDRSGRIPGVEHAKQIRDSLVDVVPDVSIVQAKEGKDATDHLNAGYKANDLVLLASGDGDVFTGYGAAIENLEKTLSGLRMQRKAVSEKIATIERAIEVLRGS